MTAEHITNATPKQARRPFWRRAFSFLVRWTYRLVCTATIIAAALIAFAQTDMFRSWVRSVVIEQVNNVLIGSLTFDDARIDVFKGIYLLHPRLYADSTTVLDASSVSVTFDLAPLLQNVVAIQSVEISNPTINVLRSATDSVWNVTRIVKPSADTTTSEPPPLHIYVRSVSVTNGTVVVNDRTTPWGNGQHFDPLHLSLHAFTLSATARADLRGREYEVVINGCSFDETTSPLDVNALSLAARADRTGLRVQHLHLVMPGTDLTARAAINDINVFAGFNDDSLKAHPVVGTIDADVVDAAHVHYFVPDVDIIGSYAVDADVVFRGTSIDVRDLHITSDNIDLHGDVDVDHLDGARPLALNIKAYDSHGSYADVRRRLRFVPLPELPFLHHTTIKNVWLRGEPDDSLWFDVDASDIPGRVDGTMSLYLNDPHLGYRVDMDVFNADISTFAADSTLRTDLNGHVRMAGRGLTFQDLDATAEIDLQRSTAFGTQCRSMHAGVRGDGHGIVTLDSLEIVFPVMRAGEGGEVTDDETERRRFIARGVANLQHPMHPQFDITTQSIALNLASILRAQGLPTRFTSGMHIRGHGLDLDSMEVDMEARTTEFMMADRAMMPFTTTAALKATPEGRSFRFTSSSRTGKPIVDMHVDGSYAPTALIDAMVATATTGVDLVRTTIRQAIDPSVVVHPASSDLRPLRATLHLVAEDASPLAMVIPDVKVMFSGIIGGRIQADAGSLRVDLDTLAVRDLRVADDSMTIMAEPVMMSVHTVMSALRTAPRLDSLSIRGRCDSLIQINDLVLRAPSVSIALGHQHGTVQASSGINAMQAMIDANVDIRDDVLTVRVDTASFTLDAQRRLQWSTIHPAVITANNKIFNIEGLAVQRAFGETVTVTGLVSEHRFGNASVVVENFNLRDITKFAPGLVKGPVALLRGLVTRTTVSVNGEWETPSISLDLAASDVSYNGERIGNMTMALEHADRTVTGSARIKSADTLKQWDALDVKIAALPLDLGFRSVEQRMVDGRPIDISMKANKLSLAVVEPFLPAIERLRGQADASIDIKGTMPNDVNFSGSGRFKNAQFIASSTGLGYAAAGTMRLKGEQLIIDTIIVKNQPRDLLRRDNRGIGMASGTVTFDGLSVESVDFTVTTPGITVMTMQSFARSPDIYGDVVIASGKAPLHFYGKLTSPHLDGDVKVLYGDVMFPPERSTTKRKITSFTYISPDDSLNEFYPSLADRIKPRAASDTATVNIDSALAARALKSVVAAPGAGFMDVLQFNLNVYLTGRFLVTMVLGLTEILIADLELSDPKMPLEYTGSFGTQTNLKGKLRLKEGTSTYKFIKPFTASGDLDFTTGGMLNPSLKLKAVYYGNRILPSSGKREDYRVQIDIAGTKLLPDAKFRLFRNDKEVVGTDSNSVKSDAIMLILLNRTQEDLTQAGQGNLVSEVNTAFSAMATSALGDLISGVGGVIQNAQFDVGSDLSQSKLTLSGQLFGNVTYRWSGTVSDISANNNFTVSFPLSLMGDADLLKYFQADVSRAISSTGNITRYQKDWEVKIGARLP